MRTRKSKLRRMRALWWLCKPEPVEVLGVLVIAGIWLGLAFIL